MRRTTVLAAAAAVPLLAAGATAAPKPAKACQLLVDRTGDTAAGFNPAFVPVDSPSLDIVSADVATGAKQLAGVLRLRALRDDPVTTTGARYSLYFTVGTVEYELRAERLEGSNDQFVLQSSEGSAERIPINGEFDTVTNSLRFTLPKQTIPGAAKGKLTNLRATTGINPVGTGFDVATGGKPYTDGQPSCVAAS